MKALSVQEPYVTLMANFEKLIETRTWSTNYRGPILLCGSKSPKGKFAGIAAVVVRLTKIRPMTIKDEFLARCEYYDRALAWIIDPIFRVKPFPVKGQLGLFEVSDRLIIPEQELCNECKTLEWGITKDNRSVYVMHKLGCIIISNSTTTSTSSNYY